jgi:hypothetical protein
MPITNLDRSGARDLHASLNQAIQDWASREGVHIKTGTFRYDQDGFKISLDGKLLTSTTGGSTGLGTIATNASLITKIAEVECRRHNLDPNKPNAKGYRLVDFNSRAHAMPWIVMAPGGKRYKLRQHQAVAYFSAGTLKPFDPTNVTVTVVNPTTPAHVYAPQF